MRRTPATLAGQTVPGRDAGFLSLELLVVATVLILVALLAVGWGRLSYSRGSVEKAAAAAARAATATSSPAAADVAARHTAQADLSAAGVSCTSFTVSVDTTAFRPGGQVTVTVRCTARLSDVALAGFPGSKTLTGSSVSPLERLRDLGTSPGAAP
jgi:Flp pilus assembly protein TadG